MIITELSSKEKTNEISSKKIKLYLSQIGLNERYQSFKYLSYILEQMIINDDESFNFFNINLNFLHEKYNISTRTISCGISILLESIKDYFYQISSQFNLSSYGTLNKIRALKHQFQCSIK